MRVLTLTPFYPVKEDDAQGCFVAEPLPWLERAGVSNVVFSAQPMYRKTAGPSHTSAFAVLVKYFALPGGLGLASAGAFLFARILSTVSRLHTSNNFDLIHAHAPLPCGHAAMLLSRELRIPYVVSVHGLDAYSTVQVTGRAGDWCRRISQVVYRGSRRVICISERVREEVLEGAGEACRTSVVYNGVDTAFFAPPARNSSATSMILSVGNLIPIKGHELLLRAAVSLAPEFAGLTWTIIGDGPERSTLQALAQRLQIAGRVHFLGRQSRKQVAEAMQRCTLFALPSRYEGLGCVYLEAMSAGKPAIGCRGQGIAEIIQHGRNGFLVGPDNDRELTLAIAMLLRDGPRCRNIGTAARETILDRFTLAHQADSLARIYRETVA